jgi:hypothetical protein
MAMTGEVLHNLPIESKQDELTQLWQQMGKGSNNETIIEDGEEKQTDENIIAAALNAANGEKFRTLQSGAWKGIYPSQSEADYAYIDIIAYYTQNKNQIARIFRNSPLGQRTKAQRADYVSRMISRAMDNRLPPLDFEALKSQLAAATEKILSQSCAEPVQIAPENAYSVPPGLLGDIARFIYAAAPRPVPEIALAGAIGYMAGICGRAYNVSGTGLNQYILLLAKTGVGKEAMASGISKLTSALKMLVPNCTDFIGASNIASAQALIKNIANSNTKSYVSILGEFGLLLQQSTGRNIDSNALGLRRCLLDLFNKSGKTDVVQPTIYSDKAQNIQAFQAPALTLLCESTPSEFYQALDERMINQGLVPRFMIIEYRGDRPDRNENHNTAQPEPALLQHLGAVCAHSLMMNASNKVIDLEYTSEALNMANAFDKECDNRIRGREGIEREIWSRAHAKVLKLAALIAVGVNIYNPKIDECCLKWSINLIESDAHNLLARLDDGSMDQITDPLKKILDRVKDKIKKYVFCKNSDIKDARIKIYHSERIVPYSYLVRHFSKNIKGPELTTALKTLVQSGELIEADNKIRETLKAKYGFECFKADLYCVDSSLIE